MTITRAAVKSWPVLGFTSVLLGYGAVRLYRWTASALRAGTYDNAAVGVLGLAFVVSALFLTVGAAMPVMRPVVTAGESGLAFSPNRAVRIAGAVSALSVLLWGAAAGLLKAIGRLHVAGDSYLITALPVIGLLCAVALGWLLLHRSGFRDGGLTVTLTPQGITGLNYGGAQCVAWTDVDGVVEVNGVVAGLPVGLTHLVIRTGDGSEYPVHQSQFCGGSMLADAIRFYWHNPERGDELVTGSAPRTGV